MGLRIQAKKSTLSNWLMIFFLFALALSAGISEFFQAPKTLNQELEQYHFLFTKDQIVKFDKIKIENRLGEFSLAKNEHGHWDLTEPRLLPASEELVTKLTRTLEGVKIRKLFPKDPINLSNFSLDNPLMKIKLSSSTSGDIEEEVHFGLVNPIDNSTYIFSESKEVIYHVDALANSLEGLGLSDFVDSKVFTMHPGSVSSFELYRGRSSLQLSLSKEKNQWMIKPEKPVQPEEVNSYLNELLEIRSALILDRLTDKLSETLDKLLTTPFYFIKVTTADGTEVTYEISTIVNSLPDVKLDKGQIYIIRASNRSHPYVFTKDSFKHYGKRNSSFKSLPFKKLFY
ncbi:MAG: DUF4340 domain-containing protein [Deltaproteobacteria bacterium]|nr:MAG: DUF4340 domain-containing protein [Deltaproteobacteria bacterium]TNF30276.1 MAG: DUF4340 domain-containing protein [Deltaproteobacteria bacterium]